MVLLHSLFYVDICPPLTNPSNGIINCSLGDDGLPYEDTCSFACNTGYELTGSDTRTCQSDGTWSGSESVCTRGIAMVTCTDFENNVVMRLYRGLTSFRGSMYSVYGRSIDKILPISATCHQPGFAPLVYKTLSLY